LDTVLSPKEDYEPLIDLIKGYIFSSKMTNASSLNGWFDNFNNLDKFISKSNYPEE